MGKRAAPREAKEAGVLIQRSVHPIGVLLLQAFDVYLPWMRATEIADILYSGCLPELSRVMEWEVARSLWEVAKKGAKTAEKPQGENAVQDSGTIIDW